MAQSSPRFFETPPATPVDEQATVTLSLEILQAIRSHYGRREIGRAAVFEALNALAASAAEVIAGTAGGGKEFFEEALDLCLDGR